ncbi:protein transport protein S31 [Gaertneriomyces sp. JEL0708]|nr:protein transport protein S31 [Gaertneriomyces sp. JEL0708]
MTLGPSEPQLFPSEPSLTNTISTEPIVQHPSQGAYISQLPQGANYGTPPPAGGYGTPPPLIPTSSTSSLSSGPPPPGQGYQYSAYPSHLVQQPPPTGHFQTAVVGVNLGGWNDIPQGALGGKTSVAHDEVLNGVGNPKALIVKSFMDAMENVKARQPASQKRMIEDTEKRLENLYERVSTDQVPPQILAMTVQIAKALNEKDFTTANNIILQLMTTSFDQEGKWVLGAKRLVELALRSG